LPRRVVQPFDHGRRAKRARAFDTIEPCCEGAAHARPISAAGFLIDTNSPSIAAYCDPDV